MEHEEFIEKSKATLSGAAKETKRLVDSGIKKVDSARKSEKATHVREATTHGFEKIMKAILPGADKKTPLIEGTIHEAPQHIEGASEVHYD